MTNASHKEVKPRFNLFGMYFILISCIFLLLFLFIISFSDTCHAEDGEIIVDESGEGDYRTISAAVINSEAGDVILVRNGDYVIDDLAGDLSAGTTIIGEDRDRTRLSFRSPASHFIIFFWDIHLENLNFTSQNEERSNIIKVFGAGNTFINCSFSNINLHIEENRFWTSMANGLTIRGNHFWNSDLTFIGPSNHYSLSEGVRGENLRTYLDHIKDYLITDNSYNGLPLYAFTDSDNITIPSPAGGLILIDCENVTLAGLDLSTTSLGITMFGCENVSITTSSILSSTNLLSLWLSSNITISQSTIGHPDHLLPSHSSVAPTTSSTLFSLYSDNVTIRNCSIHSNAVFQGGSSARIEFTAFIGISGLTLSNGENTYVLNNSFQSVGITLSSDHPGPMDNQFEHHITGNEVSGSPVAYLVDANDQMVRSDAGQVILVNCSGMTIDSLDLTSVSRGIHLYRTFGSTITNCSFSDIEEGILLQFSSENTIDNSAFEMNSIAGITIIEGDRNTIQGSSFENGMISLSGHLNSVNDCSVMGDPGPEIRTGILNNGDSAITFLTIQGLRYGIHHQMGQLTVMHSEITGNQDGIFIEKDATLRMDFTDVVQNTGNGIASIDPDHMTLIGSDISRNGMNGVELGGTISIISDCDIRNNGNNGIQATGSNGVISDSRIENNSEAGINVDLSWYLTIMRNTIHNNGAGISANAAIGYLIENCSIIGNELDGIRSSGGSYGTVENVSISGSTNGINLFFTTADIHWCTITSNSNGIYAYRPVATINVSHCVIEDNSEFGISTPDFNAFRVIAHSNYWGSSSGPTNQELNPDGRGDPIGTEIEFSPWYDDGTFTSTREYIIVEEEDDPEGDDRRAIAITSVILILPIVIGMVRFRKRDANQRAQRSGSGSGNDRNLGEAGKLKEPRQSKDLRQPKDLWQPKEPRLPRAPPGMGHQRDEITFPSGMRMASLNARVVASLIDGFIIFTIYLLIFLFLIVEAGTVDTFCGLSLVVYLFVPIEYYIFLEGYSGQTIGKGMARIRMVYQKEGQIRFGQAIRSGLIKGTIYPFGSILDGIVGIYGVHRKTLQRLSQHNAQLVVLALPKRSSGRGRDVPYWDHGTDGPIHRWNVADTGKDRSGSRKKDR